MRRPRPGALLARLRRAVRRLRRDGRLGPALVLATGLAFGLRVLPAMWSGRPHMLAVNFEVYYYAAAAALDGGSIYAATPPDHPSFRYLYPPVVVVAFAPYALLDPTTAFALHALVQVAVCVGFAALLVRYVERHGDGVALSRVDRLLVGGFVVASIHAVPTHFYGNVNLLLAAALGAALVALERGSEGVAGAAAGVAALVKVFPAAVGLWFLRRRAYRAVAAAVAVGGGLLLAGGALFGPDVLATYATEALLPRLDGSEVSGTPGPNAAYITLRQPFTALGVEGPARSLGPLVVLAPVVAYLYTGVETALDRLVAIHATVSAMLLAVPSYFVYYVFVYFPLIPLCYLLRGRYARRTFLAGAFVANFAFTLRGAENALSRADLPPAVADPLGGALAEAYALGPPPLYGMALMLVGCVVYRRRRGRAAEK